MNDPHSELMFACEHILGSIECNRRIPAVENTDPDGWVIAICEECHDHIDSQEACDEIHNPENLRVICEKCYRGEIH